MDIALLPPGVNPIAIKYISYNNNNSNKNNYYYYNKPLRLNWQDKVQACALLVDIRPFSLSATFLFLSFLSSENGVLK
jgi:hypothetical protein